MTPHRVWFARSGRANRRARWYDTRDQEALSQENKGEIIRSTSGKEIEMNKICQIQKWSLESRKKNIEGEMVSGIKYEFCIFSQSV